MEESYGEDMASHTGPESCGGGREAAAEALTGVRAGWVSSLESHLIQGADTVTNAGRQHRTGRKRLASPGPAGSKTPCTHGNTSRQRQGQAFVSESSQLSHGSREVPCPTPTAGFAL
jgi:RNA-directed DNA polymerase